MLKSGVGGEDGVVGLNNGARELGCGVNAELQLGLFAVVSGQTLEKKGTKTRSSSTTERVENEEALQTGAVVRETTELVHHGVDEFLSNSVVTTRICKT